mmetsp:Transcript_5703/g.13393  ORF Transcript_5703/g.13393 Transcript_5703/m.13393 type:complete len:93 (-) Transcript_5703:210-488(-)
MSKRSARVWCHVMRVQGQSRKVPQIAVEAPAKSSGLTADRKAQNKTEQKQNQSNDGRGASWRSPNFLAKNSQALRMRVARMKAPEWPTGHLR